MATFLYSQEEFKKGTIVKGKDVVDTFLGATGRTIILLRGPWFFK